MKPLSQLSQRLVDISIFLKTTSFFWEKELLHQNTEKISPEFQTFLREEASERIKALTSFPKYIGEASIKAYPFLKEKKAHELSRITAFLKNHYKSEYPLQLLDLCGGMGHLSLALSQHFPQMKSHTIDYDSKLISKGRKINQNPNIYFQNNNLRQLKVKDSTDLVIGLHTCGDLAEHALKCFHCSQSKSFLSWGCCYHKIPTAYYSPISEQGKTYLPLFDKYPLTLAAKSYKPQTTENINRRVRVKTYRYALELFLGKKLRTGPLSPNIYQGSFSDYLQKVCPEISQKEALKFFNENKNHIQKLISLGFKRDLWGRVIETSIILDRALFLEEKGYYPEILEFFSPEISPRNLGIWVTS